MKQTAALANVFLLFGLMLILAAGMIAVIEQPFDDVHGEAVDRCTTQACTDGTGYVNDMFTWAPLWAAGLGFVFVIGGAIAEGRRTRV